MLSIPAIIGDLGVESYLQQGTFSEGVGVSSLNLAIGLNFTVVAGYVAIVLMKKLVLNKRFHYFAACTFALGIVLIALAFLGF